MPISKCLGAISGYLLGFCLFAIPAVAQPEEVATIIDGMVDSKVIEQANYGFLAVGYDDTDDTLYFAAQDGEHFDPTAEMVYRIPISAIADVRVNSNTGKAPAGEKPYEMGCSVRLVAKGGGFGLAPLAEGWVVDGKFAVEFEDLLVKAARDVDIGFYHCDHAREMQAHFEKLRKQVKKG